MTDFENEKVALNHIKAEHEEERDFEGISDSDDEVQVGDELSDETEGSSGVESSEMSSAEETLVENGDSFVSCRKGKPSACEPQEVKNGRLVITDYIESLRTQNIPKLTFKWTKQL